MKCSKRDKIMDYIEDWPEHLTLYNSQEGGPLPYVIRSKVEPPGEAIDAAFFKSGSYYGSPRDEIEERAPHGTQRYQVARWSMITRALRRGSSCMSRIKWSSCMGEVQRTLSWNEQNGSDWSKYGQVAFINSIPW
jgi:hypothetical protein